MYLYMYMHTYSYMYMYRALGPHETNSWGPDEVLGKGPSKLLGRHGFVFENFEVVKGWGPSKIVVVFEWFWGPGAPSIGSGTSRGSFSINFYVLGCLGARFITKKPFWKFSIKYFKGFSYINCIFGLQGPSNRIGRSFSINFYVLGCLGARVITKKPFW